MSHQLLHMLRPGNDGTRLFSFSDLDDVASSSTFLDYTHPAVVSPVRHTFLYAGVDPYHDLVSGLVRSEEPTETHLSSLSRPLAEKRAGL